MKKIIFVLIASILLTCISFSMSETPPDKSSLGQKAAKIMVENLAGKKFDLSKTKGKVVFLNFWATWCPPCRSEMPSIQKLFQNIKDDKFEIVAISLDDSPEKPREFARSNNFTFPIYFDRDKSAAKKYNIRGIPATFIIDKKGEIAFQHIGSRDWASQDMLIKIKALVKY